MPSIIFHDREYCPHCFNNTHHNNNGLTPPHPCEFCNRLSASGNALMDLDYYARAEKAEWKEILMFGVMRKEQGGSQTAYSK